MGMHGWQHIVNFTFVFHFYQYDLLSWKYEANELKTKTFYLVVSNLKVTLRRGI